MTSDWDNGEGYTEAVRMMVRITVAGTSVAGTMARTMVAGTTAAAITVALTPAAYDDAARTKIKGETEI